MYILQHGTWPRTPCLLTNFLEGFDSWGEWCKLLERHHWQWHCYAIMQLCFLGSAPCIYSPSLAHSADEFSDEQVRWQAGEETAFLHFDIEPNTEDVLWSEKKSFPLYRIYVSKSFRIDDTPQPWVSASEWGWEVARIPQVSEKSSPSCFGNIAETHWYFHKSCHIFN